MRVSPYSRTTDSMVRPASYGRSVAIDGGTRGTIFIVRRRGRYTMANAYTCLSRSARRRGRGAVPHARLEGGGSRNLAALSGTSAHGHFRPRGARGGVPEES